MTENSNYVESEEKVQMGDDFASLNLSDISPMKKFNKTPKRVLHFSDGVIEEYSSDEEQKELNKNTTKTVATVDPKALPWMPWVNYWLSRSGKSIFNTLDYVGEGIADFLGITSQKYFYEIQEYKRNLKEEQKDKIEFESEMAGWTMYGTNPKDDSTLQKQAQINKDFEKDEDETIDIQKEKDRF